MKIKPSTFCFVLSGIFFVLWVLSQSSAANAQMPITVEVFSENWVELPHVAGVSVVLYDLSAPEKVKAAYAPKFPANIDAAKRAAEAYFQTPESKIFVNKMRDAHQGQIKSIKYRLTKYPAIVFNEGQYVIYGSTDVPQAVILYDKHVSRVAGLSGGDGDDVQ